jgi:hypothetical protein
MFNKAFYPLIFFAICYFLANLAFAEDLPRLDMKSTSVALFKNGLGFFIREGKVPQTSGWVVIEEVPSPILGTFWITGEGDGLTIKDTVAEKVKSTEKIDAISIEELLEANVGKMVQLGVQMVDNIQLLKGTIVSVPEDRKKDGNFDRRPQVEQASCVVFKTEEGIVVLNKRNILYLLLPEDANYQISKEEKARLKLNIQNTADASIKVTYLQKGIAWAPSYIVDISQPERAKIKMKALIINDIEDLENCTVSFVTGFPHFLFSDVLSPIGMQEDLTSFIQSLNEDRSRSRRDSSAITQQAMIISNIAAPSAAVSGYSADELAGKFQEDLFFYEKEGVTLKKGERAYYELLSDEVKYEHIYEWEIKDTIQSDRYVYEQRGGEEAKDWEQVWHSIKLQNSTKIPWTTAPAITMQGDKILGEDILYYTSIGGDSNLKITRTTEVKADSREYEVDRKHNAASFYSDNYDLVTIRGELKVVSFKDEEIVMDITKRITGKVSEQTHDGKVELVAEGIKAVNEHSIIKWNIPIEKNGQVDIRYQYAVYLRR